jgi:hypothetical protein
MRKLRTTNWILLALLGIAAGASKMMQTAQEMAFFQGEMGFSAEHIVIFGALQFLGGLMMVFKKTRLAGAILLGLTLFLSCIVVFMSGNSGNLAFGFISVIPVLMADAAAWLELKDMRPSKSEQ